MRVLIIGGSGFIGPHVIRDLLGGNHHVAILHRGHSKSNLPGNVDHILGDRQQLPELREKIALWQPDVVIDLILSSGRQAEALMATIRGIARRVIAASSGDVYRACNVLHRIEAGPLQPMPLTEDSDLRRTSQTYPEGTLRTLRKTIYPWVDEEYDKIPVERAILSDPSLPGTVLRLPMIYGPGDPLHRLFPTLKRFDDGRRTILIGDQAAQWRAPRGYVENVGAAIALAAVSDRSAGRVFNVAETPALSELEWQREVAKAVGWDGEFAIVPQDQLPAHLKVAANFAQHWIMDSSRIRTELGYREPVTQEEALRRTILWERANPPAKILPQQFDYDAEDAALAG